MVDIYPNQQALFDFTLMCPICFQNYSEKNKPLIIIVCGHTFCSLCYDHLLKKNSENDNESDTDKSEISEQNDSEDHNTDSEDSESDDEDSNNSKNNNEFKKLTRESKLQVQKFSDFVTFAGEQRLPLENISNNNENKNDIIKDEKSSKKKKNKKIKIECPKCRVSHDIYQNEVIENHQLLFYLNKLKMMESSKMETENHFVFCSECKKVDRYLSHEKEFPNHTKMLKILRKFEEFKNILQSNFDYNNKPQSFSQMLSFVQNRLINPITDKRLIEIGLNLETSKMQTRSAKKAETKDKNETQIASAWIRDRINLSFLTVFDFLILGVKLKEQNDDFSKEIENKSSNSTLNAKYFFMKQIFSELKNKATSIFSIDRFVCRPKKSLELILNLLKERICLLLNSVHKNVYSCQNRFKISYDYYNNILIFDGLLLKYKVIPYKDCFKDFTSSKRTEEGLNYYLDKNFSNKIDIDATGRYIYFIAKKDDESKKFRIYDRINKILYKKPRIPLKIMDTDTITYSKDLYVIGGHSGENQYLTNCFCFSFEKNKWITLPFLQVERKNRTLFIVNCKLYVTLGIYLEDSKSDTTRLNTEIEVLDLVKRKKWEVFAIKNINVSFCNAISYIISDSSVLLFGGETKSEVFYKGYFVDLQKFECIGEYSIKDKNDVSSLASSSVYRDLVIASSPNSNSHFFIFDMKV